MKKLICSCMIFIMLALSLSLLGCKEKAIPETLSIKNYSNYTQLGVGYVDNTRTSNVDVAEAEGQKPCQLIGKNKDGYYEQIEFDEGNDLLSRYHITQVQQVGRFIFINYANNKSSDYYNVEPVFKGSGSNPQYARGYLLDTITGKMFDISQPIEYKYGENIVFHDQAYWTTYDSVYLRYDIDGYSSIYKFTVEDGVLKAEEMINLSKMPSFYNYIVDRFGNIYSSGYIYTTKGELKQITTCGFAMNHYVYVNDHQWINSEGEVEEASFVPTNFKYLSYENRIYSLIYQEGNTYYYRIARSWVDQPNYSKIFKFEFLDDVRYNYEEISMEKYEQEEGVILKDKLYFQTNGEIYYVNIKDGSYHTINSSYHFYTIYSNNAGEIIFKGLDNHLNDVIGTIDENDIITIGVTPKEQNIYYIFSIN